MPKHTPRTVVHDRDRVGFSAFDAAGIRGGGTVQHNEALVRPAGSTDPTPIRGGGQVQHNETVIRGAGHIQHNETIVRR